MKVMRYCRRVMDVVDCSDRSQMISANFFVDNIFSYRVKLPSYQVKQG